VARETRAPPGFEIDMSAVSASADVRDLDIDGDTLREECGVFGI